MIWNLFGKIKKRLSKNNNGVFKNLLYKIDDAHLFQVIPKIDINWVWIDENNYMKVLTFREKSTASAFKKMLGANQKGIFAIYQNQSVAHCWARIGKSTDLNTKIHDLISIRENEAYIHFCHTDRNYTGNNIYPFLLYVLSKHLFEVEKVNAIFIDTSLDNIPSQKGIKKVGFHEKYLIKRFRLFGKTLIRRFKTL